MTDRAAPSVATGPSAPYALGRREMLIGGAMLATAAAAALLVPTAQHTPLSADDLEKAIPKTIGAWKFATSSGLVLPPQDETEARTYDHVLTRVYEDGIGAPIMLLIAYGGGQSGLFVIHRPEACYPAQGFRLRGREKVPIALDGRPVVDATFWTATSDIRTEQLLYWTRIGEDFPQTWADEQVTLVRNNLALRLPDGVLVRLSVLSPDPADSQRRLSAFAKALVADTGPLGRRVLLGI